MASYELNIKAMTLGDLESALADLHQRFRSPAEDPISAREPGTGGVQARQPARARRTNQTTAAGAGAGVDAPAPAPEEAPGDDSPPAEVTGGDEENGALGSDVGGDQQRADDLLGEGASAAELQSAPREELLSEDDRPADATPGQGAVEAPEASLDAVKEAARQLCAQPGGVPRMKEIMEAHGIVRPTDVAPDKLAPLLADFRAELVK